MENVNCLYYEDNEQEGSTYQRWIENAWKKLEFACPLTIEPVRTYDKAIEMLDANPLKYHLLIADILEEGTSAENGKKSLKLGLHLIEHARDLNPTIAILALTIGSEGGKDFRKEAIDSGADDYIRKDELHERKITPIELSEIIKRALLKHGHEPISVKTIVIEHDSDDISLSVVLETIGIDILKMLALKILKVPINQIYFHHVSPGFSGAHVLRLDCIIDATPGAVPKQRSVLLKVSNDKYILEAEINNKEQLEYLPSQLYLPFLANELVDANYGGEHPTRKKKWYAIGYEFQKKTKTLIDWLIEDDLTSSKITKTFSDLFLSGNGLKDVYRNTGEDKEKRPNLALNDLITPWRKVSILKAIKDFSPLADNFDPSFGYNEKKVTTFLMHNRIFECDKNSFPIGTTICRAHGDFHGRNILVNDTGIPHIIDPANICEAHWAIDIARLVVDLVVSGVDAGHVSHLWTPDKCQEWLSNSAAIIQLNLDYKNTKTSNDRILYAISFLLKIIPDIYQDYWDDHEWEFQLALAIEFLRSSYRDDISVPKRVLGLVAGCYALKNISDNYQS